MACIKTFQIKLEETLMKINREKKSFYILGDINIDLKHCGDHEATKSYIDMLFSNMCCPIITKATRVTDSTATIIDHIYSNCVIDQELHSGVIKDNISDHFPVFVSTSQKAPKNIIQRKLVRDYKNFNEEAYLNDVQNIKIDTLNDSNEYYKELMKNLNQIFDKHAPLKRQSIRQAKLSLKPWLTPGIMKSIQKKRKMYSSHFLNGNPIQRKNFKTYNNSLNRVKELSKRNYYKQKFKECEGNMKETWNLVNETIKRKSKKSKSNDIAKIIHQGEELTSPKEICNKLNEYFQNVGQDLASKISPSEKHYTEYLRNRIDTDFFIAPTNCHEIRKIIIDLDKHKALGIGDIPMKLIKKADALLSEHLTNIFNISFETGNFPDDMKLSKIIPIHKGGSLTELSNYRPISLLPIFSKILEKLMFNRLMKFFTENEVLYPYQFGFRKGYSTNLALAEITQNIYENFMNKKSTCGVFLDLSKAFDTINHEILLGKLEHYGIRGIALKWFKSYLENRVQKVYTNETLSNIREVLCGVPQGSILGPLLFLIYINDLANSSNALLFRLFADDTNIFMADSNLNRLQTNMNTELKKVNEWLKCNFLSLNTSKTKFLLFEHGRTSPKNFFVNMNGKRIEKSSEIKYLGIYLDDKLTFKYHIDILCTKISKTVGIISKLRHYTDLKTLKLVYYGLIYPHLLYGIIIWGNSNVNITKLQNKQNKIINLMHFSNMGNSFDPMSYKRSDLLKIKELCLVQTSLFTFDFYNKKLPIIFNDYLKRRNQNINIATRANENNYYQQFTGSKYANACIKSTAVISWTKVPNNIKDIHMKHVFKKRFQRYLLNNYLAQN